jgi:transposase
MRKISDETYGKIRRCNVEGMSQRATARKLKISINTVRKYWNGDVTPDDHKAYPSKDPKNKDEILKAMLNYVEDTKDKHEGKHKLLYAEIFRAIEPRFKIGYSTMVNYAHELELKHPKTFLPLEFDPAETMQIDWFQAKAKIKAGTKYISSNIYVFTAVLAYSKAKFAMAMPNMTTECFIAGHIAAFAYFGGVTSRNFYDNLRTAVKLGVGQNALKTDRFLALERHYGFKAVFMGRAAGFEKGIVESACKCVRRFAFSPIQDADSLSALQDHCLSKLAEHNNTHKVGRKKTSIKALFERERACLHPLPGKPASGACLSKDLVVDAFQTIAYDATKYSVPEKFVNKEVTAQIYPYTIEIWYKGNLVCLHQRAFFKGQDQLIVEHFMEQIWRKPRSARNASPLRIGILPEVFDQFRASCKDEDKYFQLSKILRLGKKVDENVLTEAIGKANKSGSPTYELVCYYLGVKPSDYDDIYKDEHIQPKDADEDIDDNDYTDDDFKEYDEMGYESAGDEADEELESDYADDVFEDYDIFGSYEEDDDCEQSEGK